LMYPGRQCSSTKSLRLWLLWRATYDKLLRQEKKNFSPSSWT
jgi:hypothetical protein